MQATATATIAITTTTTATATATIAITTTVGGNLGHHRIFGPWLFFGASVLLLCARAQE